LKRYWRIINYKIKKY